jgi:hypothetical protein
MVSGSRPTEEVGRVLAQGLIVEAMTDGPPCAPGCDSRRASPHRPAFALGQAIAQGRFAGRDEGRAQHGKDVAASDGLRQSPDYWI